MNCPTCGAPKRTKVIELFGVRRDVVVRCECVDDAEERVRISTLESLGASVMSYCSVPELYRDARLDAKSPVAIREKIARAIGELPDYRDRWNDPQFRETIPRLVVRGRGMGFYGTNGPGKSMAMGAFLREARERLIPGIMVPATALQNEIEESQRYSSTSSTRNVLARYARAALLVIDDIDKLEASMGSVAVALFELIDARARERRPLYLTTNVSPRELAASVFVRHDRHGAGVDDRWLDMVDWQKFAGESRRGAIA